MHVWDLKTMAADERQTYLHLLLEAGKVGGSQVASMPGKELTL